jgi:transposase
MARSGGRWRDLPERFGKFDTVKRRYYRWIETGVLDTSKNLAVLWIF